MAIVKPHTTGIVGGLPAYRGYMVREPNAIPIVAARQHATGNITQGRYRKDQAAIVGAPTLKRGDTSLSTGRNTGTIFVPNSGTWYDDWVTPLYNAYGLLVQDTTPGTLYQATTQSNLSAAIEPAEILFGRGFAGFSATDTNYAAGTCYTLMTWGVGARYQYQMRFKFGQSPSLWFSSDTGTTWELSAQNTQIPTLETLLADNQNLLHINVHMDPDDRVFYAEIGTGYRLTPALPLRLKGAFADPAKFRIDHQNGWLVFAYFNVRHSDVQITTPKESFADAVPLDDTRIVTNGLTVTPTDQTTSYTLIPEDDGKSIRAEVTATRPDAGDGKGSALPAILADATLVIPSIYTNEINGIPDFRTATLAIVHVTEHLSFNPITRLYSSSASCVSLNRDGALTEMIGSLYLELWGTNGIVNPVRRFSGVTTLPSIAQRDPDRTYSFQADDMMVYLNEPIGTKAIFDGWCLWSVVRFVCDACGIHPQWLSRIPLYVPPGATERAPYGQAGYDCPYYILKRGMGLNPKYEYNLATPGIAVLQELVQDLSEIDPMTGTPAPYIMGMDAEGYFRFEPYFISQQTPKGVFSDLDFDVGYSTMLEGFRFDISTENVRSSLHLMGIDAFSREVLNVRRPGTVQARALAGRPKKYIDESSRWQDLEQMGDAIDTMLIPASMPEILLNCQTIYRPDLFPGDTLYVHTQRYAHYNGLYVIEDMVSLNGHPAPQQTDCFSRYKMRSAISYL